MRDEVARILRADLRHIRARIAGLGRDSGVPSVDHRRLIVDLEEAAFYTREALAIATAPGSL